MSGENSNIFATISDVFNHLNLRINRLFTFPDTSFSFSNLSNDERHFLLLSRISDSETVLDGISKAVDARKSKNDKIMIQIKSQSSNLEYLLGENSDKVNLINENGKNHIKYESSENENLNLSEILNDHLKSVTTSISDLNSGISPRKNCLSILEQQRRIKRIQDIIAKLDRDCQILELDIKNYEKRINQMVIALKAKTGKISFADRTFLNIIQPTGSNHKKNPRNKKYKLYKKSKFNPNNTANKKENNSKANITQKIVFPVNDDSEEYGNDYNYQDDDETAIEFPIQASKNNDVNEPFCLISQNENDISEKTLNSDDNHNLQHVMPSIQSQKDDTNSQNNQKPMNNIANQKQLEKLKESTNDNLLNTNLKPNDKNLHNSDDNSYLNNPDNKTDAVKTSDGNIEKNDENQTNVNNNQVNNETAFQSNVESHADIQNKSLKKEISLSFSNTALDNETNYDNKIHLTTEEAANEIVELIQHFRSLLNQNNRSQRVKP